MKFSKSVLQLLDAAIGQQLDTVDLTKQSKLALELLQARREIRAALDSPRKPDTSLAESIGIVNGQYIPETK